MEREFVEYLSDVSSKSFGTSLITYYIHANI